MGDEVEKGHKVHIMRRLGVTVRHWIFILHKVKWNWRILCRNISLHNTFSFGILIFLEFLFWIHFRRNLQRKVLTAPMKRSPSFP